MNGSIEKGLKNLPQVIYNIQVRNYVSSIDLLYSLPPKHEPGYLYCRQRLSKSMCSHRCIISMNVHIFSKQVVLRNTRTQNKFNRKVYSGGARESTQRTGYRGDCIKGANKNSQGKKTKGKGKGKRADQGVQRSRRKKLRQEEKRNGEGNGKRGDRVQAGGHDRGTKIQTWIEK